MTPTELVLRYADYGGKWGLILARARRRENQTVAEQCESIGVSVEDLASVARKDLPRADKIESDTAKAWAKAGLPTKVAVSMLFVTGWLDQATESEAMRKASLLPPPPSK